MESIRLSHHSCWVSISIDQYTWNSLVLTFDHRWMEWILPGDHLSLSAIRTIRVLRPLRAINRVPSMRTLVMLLLDTLPMLGNVLLLCFFVFFIFGIVGVQLWKGLLRNRCFLSLNITHHPHLRLFKYVHDTMEHTLPSLSFL